MKATKVDGIYDKDSIQYTDAVKLDAVTFQESVENDNIKVMDKGALSLAMEQNMPVIIFELAKDGNILRAVFGESIGTKVS